MISGKTKSQMGGPAGLAGDWSARFVASPVAPGHVTTRPLEYNPVCWLAGRAQCN